MEGIEGTSGRLGVCPRCGRTAELMMCPACNLEMIDCEKERDSEEYNDYKEARQKAMKSETVDDIACMELARMAWQDYIFKHYISKKSGQGYDEDAVERSSFIDKVCPFCDSLKTRKITFSEKFADFRSNGFKSKKREMYRHCNDCNRDY